MVLFDLLLAVDVLNVFAGSGVCCMVVSHHSHLLRYSNRSLKDI
jgi:hypothetical protein